MTVNSHRGARDWVQAIVPEFVLKRMRLSRELRRVPSLSRSTLQGIYSNIERALEIPRLTALKIAPASADSTAPAKYTDYGWYLRFNIVRAARLGLSGTSRLRIMDIGCGPGYFVAVCRHFGHDCWGLDVPDEVFSEEERSVYNALCHVLRVENYRLRGCVRTRAPLPFSGQFDLITGFQVNFHVRQREGVWSVDEWTYFLDDLESHLTKGGRMHLELIGRKDPSGTDITLDAPTTNFLVSRGLLQGRCITTVRET